MRGSAARSRALSFAPHLLDGVEVRGVGGQKDCGGSGLGDAFEHCGGLVCGEVVHDDDVPGSQRGAEDFAHVGGEHFAVGGSLDGYAVGAAIQPDGAS